MAGLAKRGVRLALLCLLAGLLLPGCAGHGPQQAGSWLDRAGGADKPSAAVLIGPYADFSGRLIVIEPKRRWQVLLKWRADTPERGWLRITHAATATVVELGWQGDRMVVRDNQQPDWRRITQSELSSQGIVIPPRQLAAVLLGQMPPEFHFTGKRTGQQTWESREHGQRIILRWQPESRRLTMTDMKQGRKASLMIQP